ncbi:unnamed protein product, partial [Symbiodinium sp. KB8]
VSTTIERVLGAVDACSNSGEAKDYPTERHFWLLRYAGHETEMWFQLLCRTLLSPDCMTDFKRFNPFLTEAVSSAVTDDVCDVPAMDHCRNLMDLLDRDNVSSSAVALKAGLTEKCASQTIHQYAIKAGALSMLWGLYSHCRGDATVSTVSP